MSLNVFEIFAKIGLDTSEYDKGLSGAKDKLSSFGSSIGSVGKAIGTGVATAAKVGIAAVGAATTAVTAFGATVVKTGMTFDSSMSQVAATMGYTKDQLNQSGSEASENLKKLRDFAQEMGRTTSFSASEAADALNYMALAGYNADESMQMLPTVLNLAASGAMDLGLASDMVTDTQSALGLSMEETAQMVDQMAAAASNSNTSVSQLGDAMLQIGATAKNLKGGTVELSTVLGALADNGIKGAEGGTHLRNMLLSLQTPTKDGIEAMKKLGMSYEEMYDSAGNMRALPEIFQEMSEKMEGMNQASKDAIVSGIFNKTDLASVNALLNTSTERWGALTNAITDSTGAAEEMAKVQLDNLDGDIKLFISALEGAKIAISDKLTPSLREFVQFGSDGISKITDAFTKGGINEAMEVFGNSLSDALNKLIEGLPKAIDAGMKLLGALGQGLLDNLPVIVDAAVQIINELLAGLLQAAPSLLEGALQILVQLATGLGELAPTIIPDAVNAIIDTILALLENVDALVDGAIALVMGLADGIINALPILLDRLPEIIVKLVDALIVNAPKLAGAGPQLVLALIQGIIGALPEFLALGPRIVTGLLEALVNDAPKMVEGGISQMKKLIEGIVGMIPDLLALPAEIVTKLAATFVNVAPNLIESGQRLVAAVGEGVSNLVDNAAHWGADLIDSFVSGIMDNVDKVIRAAEDLASKVKDIIGFSEPKKGPLSNFHTFAPDMMDLFAKGIKDNTNGVIDQLKESFDFGDIIKDQTVEVGANINTGITGGSAFSGGNLVQNLTINAPQELDPSEIARQTKSANRELMLQLRMA